MKIDDSTRETYRRRFLIAVALAVTILFTVMIHNFLIALFFAVAFSSLIYPVYRWIAQRLGARKSLASAATVLVGLLAVIVPVTAFLGLAAAQALEVSERISPWVQEQLNRSPADFRAALPEWLPVADVMERYRSQIVGKAGDLTGQAAQFLVSSVSTATEGTVVFLVNLFIMLYAMFFCLVSGRESLSASLRHVPMSAKHKDLMVERVRSVLRATVKGTFAIGIVQGALAGLAFAVAGINGAVFWGTLMAVLSVIPGIGAALIWVPAVIWLFVQDQMLAAIGLSVWCATVVGLADNVLRPMLVGRDTRMSDLVVLLSTLGGLAMFGAVGIVVGPVVAALFVAIWHIYAEAFSEALATEDQ